MSASAHDSRAVRDLIAGMAVREAASALELSQVWELFVEYAAWLAIDLSFQNFAQEVAALPGDYAGPAGRLLIADADGQAAGCVAVRSLDKATAEMKRLWVRPAFRRSGVGRMLVSCALDAAGKLDYQRLVLDTLPQMSAAMALYRSFGFREVPAYYQNPLPGAIYMALELR